MKISSKVVLGFALLFAIILVQLNVEYRQAALSKRDLELFEKSTVRESEIAGQLIRIGTMFEAALVNGAGSVPGELDDMMSRELPGLLKIAKDATSSGLDIAGKNGGEARVNEEREELRVLAQVENGFAVMTAAIRAQAETSVDAARRMALRRDALGMWRGTLRPLLERYGQRALDEFLGQTRGNLQRSHAAFYLLLGMGGLALVIMVAAGFWIVRSVMNPLRQATDVAREIAEGGRGRRLSVGRGGEFSMLARSFNEMLDRQDELTRKRDEMGALAESRLREFDDFFGLSMDILCIANLDGHFVRINAAMVSLLGHAEQDILNRPFLEFVHPDDREATNAQSLKLTRGERVSHFENRYRCSDGSWKWISWHVTPRLEAGRLYAVGRDVTEKKRVEADLHESQEALCRLNSRLEEMVAERTLGLQESEERFRLLVEGVNDYAIFMLDVDGRIASWNSGAERIKGYKASEIIGQHMSVFYGEADVARGHPMYVLELAKTRGRFEDTGWRVCKDGRKFWAHVVINALRDKDGILLGFAKITRDITEQQRTSDELIRQQELLRSLMENLAEGVVACDAAGKLSFFNRTAREWHGTDIVAVPPEQWSESFGICAADGKTPLEMEEIPLVRAAAGERVRDAEMVIARKGHPLRWVIASGDPLVNAEGAMIGAVVVMKDITERRNAERSNLRTQRLESLGTLSGGIAHDLNNALAPILMGMELLHMRYPECSAMISGMEKSAKRGAGMVRQLLTFARGVDGERICLEPRHFVGEMAGIIAHTFPKNIECRLQIDADVRPVLGDATQLHQVMLNLCVNARDAMPEGGVITIEAANRSPGPEDGDAALKLKPGDYVCIRIRDTGSGIPPEIIEHIFDPFFTTKPVDKGTGLGLSTVLGIMRNHEGWVQVASTPGCGTCFTLWLPAARGGVVAASRTPFVAAPEIKGENRLVLIVDDEPVVLEILRTVLQALEFQVITAEDGEQGVARLDSLGRALSLVITDRHMPRMDGMEFASKIRERLPGIPLVVASGRMENDDKRAFVQMGVSALLHKPFTRSDLIKVLVKVFAPR